VWTGSQVIVFGGTNPLGANPGDGAIYSPSQRRWQRLPPFPTPPTAPGVTQEPVSSSGVWTGTELIVMMYEQSQQSCSASSAEVSCTATSGRTIVATWHPGSTGWTLLPPPPVSLSAADATTIWTGEGLFVVGGSGCPPGASCPSGVGSQSGDFDIRAGTWTLGKDLRPAPLGPVEWTGRAAVVLSAPDLQGPPGDFGDEAVIGYDPASGHWDSLPSPTPQAFDPVAVWTGSDLVVWAGSTEAWELQPGP